MSIYSIQRSTIELIRIKGWRREDLLRPILLVAFGGGDERNPRNVGFIGGNNERTLNLADVTAYLEGPLDF